MTKVYDLDQKGYVALKRIPMGLICDISSSMETEKEILKKAIGGFMDHLKSDTKFAKSVDLLIIYYNGDYKDRKAVQVKANFEPLERIKKDRLLDFVCEGYTDTGLALLEGCRLLDEKKKEYKREQIDYYQPMLFLLTDGYPVAWKGAKEEEKEEIRKKYEMAVAEIHQRVSDRKLSIAAAGIQRNDQANSANMETLRELTPNAIRISEDIEGLDTIMDFFDFLEDTLTEVQKDTPVDEVLHEVFL